jgi:hypothetical protein
MILLVILGCVDTLRYSDHDVVDMENFLDFLLQVYTERKESCPLGVPILEPKQWIAGLYNRWIINLL